MSLDNLVKTKQLLSHQASPEAMKKLLSAAKRNHQDALCEAISPENRFDAAYKAIMQCAMLGLWSCGYRTSSSQPGHHQVAIQSLPLTIKVDRTMVIVLDALRKQRNVSDYEGDPISNAALSECISSATRLINITEAWLEKHYA